MAAPVTTVFDGSKKNMGKIKEKIVRGIVRHYRIPESEHHPYQAMLTDLTDLSRHEIKNIQNMIWDFPDGEEIEIVITSKGESPCAHGFVWMRTESGIYERVPMEEWHKTLPKEAGC